MFQVNYTFEYKITVQVQKLSSSQNSGIKFSAFITLLIKVSLTLSLKIT